MPNPQGISRLGGCRSCCSAAVRSEMSAFDEVRQQFATSSKHPTARLAKMQAGKLDAKHPHHRTLARPAKGKISMKLEFRQRLLTTTLMVGASMVASPAFAQMAAPATNTPSPPDNSATPSAPDTTAPQAGQTEVPSTNAQGGTVSSSQDIVITGTRIPQPNLTSASPVTVLSAQEVKLQGTTRTEDLINSLPQVSASMGRTFRTVRRVPRRSTFAAWVRCATLVLINGRRLQPGDPTAVGNVPDINFVPSAIIKRVEC